MGVGSLSRWVWASYTSWVSCGSLSFLRETADVELLLLIGHAAGYFECTLRFNRDHVARWPIGGQFG